MTGPLGISVGISRLAAARAGAAPVIRPAAVTISDQVWTDVVDAALGRAQPRRGSWRPMHRPGWCQHR